LLENLVPLYSGKLTTPRQAQVLACTGEMNIYCSIWLLNGKKFVSIKLHTLLW
jgi:hypothetical protein